MTTTRSYPRLTIEAFGAELLRSGDLDPVYDALVRVRWEPEQMARFLLAYLLCYHCGAAAWFSERSDDQFWAGLMDAAENTTPAPPGGRWPRSPERRHWRGQMAVASVAALSGCWGTALEVVEWWAGGDDGPANPEPFADVARRVKSCYGFGDWVAYKTADMLERVWGTPVAFTVADAMYDSPRKAALELYITRNGYSLGSSTVKRDAEGGVVGRVTEYLLEVFQKHQAPGLPGRPVGLQEVETILCKFASHNHGHYEPYHDLREITAGLGPWLSVSRAAKEFAAAFRMPPKGAELAHAPGVG